MGHFVSFNGEIKKEGSWTSLPAQTDFAEYLAGQVFTEKAGELLIEETFDLAINPTGNQTLTEWAAAAHWTLATWVGNEASLAGKKQTTAKFEVKAGETVSFNASAGAPVWRVVLKIPGVEDSKVNRLFVRAFERGRI